MKTGVIYRHVNKQNGRCYIGSTVQNPERRWRKSDPNYNAYKTCPVFYKALCKYTWQNFDSEILEENVPEDLLHRKEEEYINHYDSLAPNGYNTVEIVKGQTTLPLSTRQKISKNRSTPNVGKPAVNRHHHINIAGVPHKKCTTCKEVLPLSSYGSYKSNWDGLHWKCRSCHNQYRKRYSQKKLSEKELQNSYATRKTSAQKIIAFEVVGNNILHFESISEAGRNGFNRGSIRRAISQNIPYKGYTWQYADSVATKINARSCEIREVGTLEERSFLKQHHRQGYCVSRHQYGLYYNNELVIILTLGVPRWNRDMADLEIVRLCTKRGVYVRGGASKLFKHAIKVLNPTTVMTYAHIDYAKAGEVYPKLGFEFVRKTPKGYFYQKGEKVISRHQAQKKKLYKLLGQNFDPALSERENMAAAGYTRIQDAGNNLYLWKKSS